MSKYAERISDNSVWVTATPTPVTASMPFYATEAGHFTAEADYMVSREFHDSFLLLYTVSGSGIIHSENNEIALTLENAVIIDCRSPHSYHSTSEKWEFLWLHLCGSAAAAMTDILFPTAVHAVLLNQPQSFERCFTALIEQIHEPDVISSIEASTSIHQLYNYLIHSVMENENANRKKEHASELDAVLEFIRDHYSENITIDDMLDKIHLSKYHFIRIFRRIMGTTPYSYLINYRINTAKYMLRTTDKSIADIALDCGFMDASNFITQFKKHTGLKPLQYRRDFT